MRGTYELHVRTAADDTERIVLVLAEKCGAWRGAIIELMCRMFIMENGEVSNGGFLFHIPPSLTIFGDVTLDVRGRVEGDAISGELVSEIGRLPFSGKRISDAVFPLG